MTTKHEEEERVRLIASQWAAFSNTEAYKDFIAFGEGTVDNLISSAMEGVLPYTPNSGDKAHFSHENAISLLTNAHGCGIMLSYAKEYVDLAKNKRHSNN